MARVIVAALAAVMVAAAGDVSIQFGTVPKTEIENRLRTVEYSNPKRAEALRRLFEESQCTGDQLTEQRVKYVKTPNILCTLPGETDSLIIVGAHFDFVDRGRGVVDNWSGCSLLPSLYQSLKSVPRHHTILFIGFTDEEKGLVGSKFYVEALRKDDLAKIHAMVNIDSLGTSTTKVEITRGDKRLVNALAIAAQTFKLPLSAVNGHAVGKSDSDSFQDRKVPAISVHSLTAETFPILHTRRDQMDAIHLDDYYDTYLLLRAYIAYLDQILGNPPTSEAITSAPAVK